MPTTPRAHHPNDQDEAEKVKIVLEHFVRIGHLHEVGYDLYVANGEDDESNIFFLAQRSVFAMYSALALRDKQGAFTCFRNAKVNCENAQREITAKDINVDEVIGVCGDLEGAIECAKTDLEIAVRFGTFL